MRELLLATILTFITTLAVADIVKQVNPDGSITYVNKHKTAPQQAQPQIPEDPNIGDTIDGVKVYSISAKPIKRSRNYVYVAIKIQVKNNTHDQDVDVKYEALDRNGFQLAYGYADGLVRPGYTGFLTDQKMIEKAIYPRIKTWRAKP